MEENYFSEKIKVDSNVKNTKKSVSVSTLIISIITTIVFIFIVITKWPNILGFVGIDQSQKDQLSVGGLSVGADVIFTGTITNDGDIVNYTHTIKSLEFGEIGLKSSKINLSNYSNEVYLEGIVERVHQGLPIVLVDTIYSLDLEDGILEEEDSSGVNYDLKYLPKLGIYLDSEFFQKYSLLNDGAGGTLKMKKSDTNQIINLSYFNCSKTNNNQNCDRFHEMFSESSTQKFVDSYGITYYKQIDVKSRFFSNDSLFGYFINDTEDDLVKDVVKYIQVINKKFVEKNILNKVDLLCMKDGKGIKNMVSNSFTFKNNDLIIDIKGNDSNNSYECSLKIEPSIKNMAQLISLDSIGENEINTEDKIQITGNNTNNDGVVYDWNTQVKQFPTNLEKSLTFKSSRGHSFVFPSSNLSYSSQAAQEDFGQAGVNCSFVMNVVQYSEKDLVEQKGSVKIYECSVKNTFDDSDKKLIYKNLGEKHFVIEIVDPAWVDFANNISINIS